MWAGAKFERYELLLDRTHCMHLGHSSFTSEVDSTKNRQDNEYL